MLPVPVPSGAGVCLQQPGTQSQGSRRKSAVKGGAPAAAGLGSRPGGPGASASTPEAQTSCRAAHLPWGSQGSSDPLEALRTVLKPRTMGLIRKADGSDVKVKPLCQPSLTRLKAQVTPRALRATSVPLHWCLWDLGACFTAQEDD